MNKKVIFITLFCILVISGVIILNQPNEIMVKGDYIWDTQKEILKTIPNFKYLDSNNGWISFNHLIGEEKATLKIYSEDGNLKWSGVAENLFINKKGNFKADGLKKIKKGDWICSISNYPNEEFFFFIDKGKDRYISRGSFIDENMEVVIKPMAENNCEILFNNGDVIPLKKEFNLGLNSDGWYLKRDNELIKNVAGIIYDGPKIDSTKIYKDLFDKLKNKEKIILIYIDGLSFRQYNEYIKDHKNGFFDRNYNPNPMRAMYPSITNANYATMITGVYPSIHGVYTHGDHIMQKESVFKYAKDNDISAKILEGDAHILNTEIGAKLHLDKNNNDTSDDEIYSTMRKELDNDFLFVHFHYLDDLGHNLGPISEKGMNYLNILEKYIEDIEDVWNGYIYVVSDHGMHNIEGQTGHGWPISEDLWIPYVEVKNEK